EVLHIRIEWLLYKIEKSRIYKKDYEYARHQPGDVNHPRADHPEEQMIFCHKAEEPEYPECRHHSYGLNEADIVGEEGGRQDHQNQGGHYGHDIDNAVAILHIGPAVGSSIEPQQI